MIDFRFKFFTYQLIYTLIYKYELSLVSGVCLLPFVLLFTDTPSLLILESNVTAGSSYIGSLTKHYFRLMIRQTLCSNWGAGEIN